MGVYNVYYLIINCINNSLPFILFICVYPIVTSLKPKKNSLKEAISNVFPSMTLHSNTCCFILWPQAQRCLQPYCSAADDCTHRIQLPPLKGLIKQCDDQKTHKCMAKNIILAHDLFNTKRKEKNLSEKIMGQKYRTTCGKAVVIFQGGFPIMRSKILIYY